MLDEIVAADNRSHALSAHGVFWGAAAAFNGGEAVEGFQEFVSTLSGEDSAVDLQDDPLALSSLVQLGAGAHERVKVSA